MATGKAILNALRQELNLSDYRKKHWEGSFDEYLDIVREHPEVTRTAYQRLYDMIISHGTEEVYENKEKVTRYKFFTEFAAKHGDAIYGLDRPLMHLANQFKAAAKGYGPEKRVLLLHGPVGSSKSTIARLLKKGLEEYSRTDEGMLFSFAWKGDNNTWQKCPMHEDPLRLAPLELRPALLARLIEVLKLDVAFLYDLLGASQEHKIKPKKFAQTDIDEVILGHTNEPEYRRLQNNEFMEALRDRTVKIDIPYVTRLKDEIRIYEKDFNPERVKGKHIAPHTIEIAAMWAVLTRLVQPKHANLTLLQKLKLYNGKTLPGFTEDNVVELKREAVNEGMHGISPRYIQDKISNALVAHPEESCVNPFMVLHELETGLRHHSLITSQEQLQHCRELLSVVKEEYEDIVKNEVQSAIADDEDDLTRLC